MELSFGVPVRCVALEPVVCDDEVALANFAAAEEVHDLEERRTPEAPIKMSQMLAKTSRRRRNLIGCCSESNISDKASCSAPSWRRSERRRRERRGTRRLREAMYAECEVSVMRA